MYACMHVCIYVCMWLNWLECAVGDWQHPGPLGQSSSAGGPYISFLGQGTNIQLPFSPECQFCPSSKLKYIVTYSDY